MRKTKEDVDRAVGEIPRCIGCLVLTCTAGVIALAVVPVLFRVLMNAARLTA